MFRNIRQSILFKNTFIYTFVQLFNKGIPLLLLPILTQYLTPEDYGMIATFSTLVGALSVFVGLSMSGAVAVSYFQLTQVELKKYIGNVFTILIVSAFVILSLMLSIQPFIVEKLNLESIWIYMAIGIAFMQMITSINLTLWRSEQKAKPFALYEMSQTFFNIFLSLFFIILLHYAWEGRILATVIATMFFGLLSIVVLYKRGYFTFNFSLEYSKDALKFGIYLIPHQLALWMRSGVDIVLITSLIGVSSTGLYTVGFQLGAVVGIFANAFNSAFSPYLYQKLNNITENMQKKLVYYTYIYFIFIVVFAMLLSTFFVILADIFLPSSFQGATEYIYIISLAYAFHGMYLMVVNYIFYAKKNHLISMVTIGTSLLHVVISYLLIQKFGAIGAAYASVISFCLTFLLIWKISARVVKMPWGLKSLNLRRYSNV